MKGAALFAGVSLAIILAVGWLLGLTFASPDAERAIWISAAVAYVVQLFTFAIARLMARDNVIAGWGVGVLMRFVTLVVYALLIVRNFDLAPTAALISLATFFFLTTLIEPLLLKV